LRISNFPKGEVDALIIRKTMTVFEWIDIASTLPIEGLELYAPMFWDQPAGFAPRVGDVMHARGLEMPTMCASPRLHNRNRAIRHRENSRLHRSPNETPTRTE
jgi:hypothetical protein